MNASQQEPSKERFQDAQKDRTLHHPNLLPNERSAAQEFSFVVCADTQYGMATNNLNWEVEEEYSRKAIQYINQLEPAPLFCCICGDLVNMTSNIYQDMDEEECNRIQDLQNRDMKNTWGRLLKPQIALVCLCGNHDVGNRPTPALIQRYKDSFGDDFLAFWVHSTYHIVLNTNLFSDPTDAIEQYNEQLVWLEQRLQHARDRRATHIFVFGHHPWFLFDQNETAESMTSRSHFPGGSMQDSYFHIPKERRLPVLKLFQEYNVTACFAGHFHQNLVSQTAFGMPMIVTSALSMILQTDHPSVVQKKKSQTQGLRIVNVNQEKGIFTHRFEETS